MLRSKTDKKVDEVFGIPIYFNPFSEQFYAECDEREYQGSRLSDVRRDLEADRPLELDEPVIYADSGEMVLTNIINIWTHGSLTTGKRAGFGVSPAPAPANVFPQNAHNMAVYKRHKKMRDEGWSLIQQADSMSSELEPYPKGYWDKKAREIRATK